MIREKIICKKCKTEITQFICDECGKDLLIKYNGVPVTLFYGHGSPLDGEKYHFCNNKEALEFLANEEKKSRKDDTIF